MRIKSLLVAAALMAAVMPAGAKRIADHVILIIAVR